MVVYMSHAYEQSAVLGNLCRGELTRLECPVEWTFMSNKVQLNGLRNCSTVSKNRRTNELTRKASARFAVKMPSVCARSFFGDCFKSTPAELLVGVNGLVGSRSQLIFEFFFWIFWISSDWGKIVRTYITDGSSQRVNR